MHLTEHFNTLLTCGPMLQPIKPLLPTLYWFYLCSLFTSLKKHWPRSGPFKTPPKTLDGTSNKAFPFTWYLDVSTEELDYPVQLVPLDTEPCDFTGPTVQFVISSTSNSATSQPSVRCYGWLRAQAENRPVLLSLNAFVTLLRQRGPCPEP